MKSSSREEMGSVGRERGVGNALPSYLMSRILVLANVKRWKINLLFRRDREEVWIALSAIRFGLDGNEVRRSLASSGLSWKRLHDILRTWLPREGFYTLLDANPVGLLFSFSFGEGKFVGKALTPAYPDEEEEETYFHSETIFEVTFSEDGYDANMCGMSVKLDSFLQEGFEIKSLRSISGDDVPALRVGPRHVDVRAVDRAVLEGKDDDDEDRAVVLHRSDEGGDGVFSRWFRRLSSATENQSFKLDKYPRIEETWARANTRSEEDADSAHLAGTSRSMMKELIRVFARHRCTMSFQYVDGPVRILSSTFKYSHGMPLIRPGLYHGVYNGRYGKYRREIILVEYRRYAWSSTARAEQNATMTQIGNEVFSQLARQRGWEQIRLRITNFLNNSGSSDVVFVVGRKVTGDWHVPMRQITFVALVHPQMQHDAESTFRNLRRVRDRGEDGSGKSYDVIRSFVGWGTLAFPGFRRPSWNDGTLCQIRTSSSEEEEDDAFAFVWGQWSHRTNEACVLRWIKTQSRFPFFSNGGRKSLLP